MKLKKFDIVRKDPSVVSLHPFVRIKDDIYLYIGDYEVDVEVIEKLGNLNDILKNTLFVEEENEGV